MKYNYVFFNASDSKNGSETNGFYTICLKDLSQLKNVQIVSIPLENKNIFIRFVKRIHYKIGLPGKSLWYPYWMKLKFKNNKPLCFVFACGYDELGYYKYLKEKYMNCRIVKIHRDLVEVFLRGKNEFFPIYNKEIMSPYDLLYLFDKNEAIKYNGIYTPFISFNSRIDVKKSNQYPLSDVFFAGRAKDRLPKLMALYKTLTRLGLKVEYYLIGVPSEMRKDLPGIEYGNKMLSYGDMLYRSVNSRCLLELTQAETNGFTQRFIEALIYNKKLITDNYRIKEVRLYNKRFIKFVDEIDITIKDFILNDSIIDYNYNNEFSPIRILEDIEKRLYALDENKTREHE